MLAMRPPVGTDDGKGLQMHYGDILPDASQYTGFTDAFDGATTEQRIGLLLQELASDRVGDHVSIHDIDVALRVQGLVTQKHFEIQLTAIAVLLKWDRQLREGISEGKYTLWDLELIADPAEVRAVAALEVFTHLSGSKLEIKKLIDSIPDSELRKQSRRDGLIAAWQAYEHEPWRKDYVGGTTYGKVFARHSVGDSVSRLRFEQNRSDRFIDQLTRLVLEQLGEGLPLAESSPQFIARHRLWTEASGPRQYPDQKFSIPFGKHWTSTHETRIDRLRARSAAMQVSITAGPATE
jgi:hypothetical protein